MPSEIDWQRFRVGTVVGSKVDNKIYQVTDFAFSEQADIGQSQNIRQNVELELEEEPTGRAKPDWWIPDIHAPGMAASYLTFDGHAYMVMVYDYEFHMMRLKVELTRAVWVDQDKLTPFQQAIQAFRQSLTSSQ